MPARKDLERILIIGSGPIVIGQACEFDYSGTQAVRALKEEDYRVILANPNPATVMTTPDLADRVYMEPLKVEYIEQIIRHERPDAILPTMGGQTALNLTLKLYDEGILARYGVEVIGANVESIRKAEDRGSFKKIVKQIGLEVPCSIVTDSIQGAKKMAREVGLPLVIRPSFTLGGQGGSIAFTSAELEEQVFRALDESPVGQALIEESLIGWKEFELEVMRDRHDNAMVVCSIENIDPMGIHTGDSITVAPIQTLSDNEYQRMRTASLEVLRAIGVDCGGSNVQFAVKPDTGRMVIVEMNPRVSRSSALASKATGFPIARCSARLAIGFTLDEIINEITGKTYSCFEPTLDYCVVKVPRFELEKFPLNYDRLGTQMKSVGEALAIGRSFIEALNKAIRSAELGYEGLELLKNINQRKLSKMLATTHPLRIFAVYMMIKNQGQDCLNKLHKITSYDPWFLYNILELVELENKISSSTLDKELLLEAKRNGLSDKQIARLNGMQPNQVSDMREAEKIFPSYHFVDTCAGEFEAKTPYFYSSYGEINEGGKAGRNSVVILASGPNRIGQGLEFDTCCTLTSLAYRKYNVKTIIINSNPETVSTDFNISDRLYIEPLVLESVKEVIRKEKTRDVIIQLGGQTALNMAADLEKWGARIVGTPVQSILSTEDRKLFSALLSKLNIKQPENRTATSPEQVIACSNEIQFPVLLRPSFVLGGRSMFIAYEQKELANFLKKGIRVDKENPVLVDRFLEDAYEYDLDALADGKNVYIAGIMQHIEAAGIHSGDSACVFPPYKSDPDILEQMVTATKKIAREVGISGFLNIQFAVKDGILYVLEVNPRASRTVPYISKASGINLLDAAVRIWRGEDLKTQGLTGRGECKMGWAVKEAVFSFERFEKLDPILGPEMKSTGEVIGIGKTFGEAFAKAQASAGTTLPKGGRVFISIHDQDKKAVLPIVKDLQELGFTIASTRGTSAYFFKKGIFPEVILKIHEGRPNVIDHMRHDRFSLLINTPLGGHSQKGDQAIRIEGVKRKIPYTTTISAAQAAVEGIRHLKSEEIEVRPLLKEEN